MHILNVEIKDWSFSEETGRHQATLLMDARQNRISLRAETAMAQASPQHDVMNGLLADAMRQLKRLPEYRGSEQEITLAQNALRA